MIDEVRIFLTNFFTFAKSETSEPKRQSPYNSDDSVFWADVIDRVDGSNLLIVVQTLATSLIYSFMWNCSSTWYHQVRSKRRAHSALEPPLVGRIPTTHNARRWPKWRTGIGKCAVSLACVRACDRSANTHQIGCPLKKYDGHPITALLICVCGETS